MLLLLFVFGSKNIKVVKIFLLKADGILAEGPPIAPEPMVVSWRPDYLVSSPLQHYFGSDPDPNFPSNADMFVQLDPILISQA